MQDNAILNAIAKRSSIREYTGEVVSRDQLETIIKAGMAAPSAMNHQPWEFVAIDDRALLDKLGDVWDKNYLDPADEEDWEILKQNGFSYDDDDHIQYSFLD